ncbi:MepB family protein [Maribacter sp. TH_r10]|uniref:MepB family protein n=1 Tax=Maribacter luteus TaxID=2594478 RepID=A0A6I2MQH9_9FLAO|nr:MULTISPECIES: MepB family protein [Maribacter]MDV7139750.1 MepB family protein [Maribacter sp. TH_r10]MRX65079.1 MepB family protein [Maribacter luteus]
MDKNLSQIKIHIYDQLKFVLSDLILEPESKAYGACNFKLNKRNIRSRSAKITPKKAGQFVTFWKRQGIGPIEPFNHTDNFDLLTVNVRTDKRLGQFVFPKSVLLKNGIISNETKEGKRAFRVYPKWDIANNKQAIKTQEWQLDYFYEINGSLDLNRVMSLYHIN